MAVHSQNVIDTTDAKTFTQESKFCLRALAELDAFVHSSNEVRLYQELLRDELSRSDSDSECDASSVWRPSPCSARHQVFTQEVLHPDRPCSR